MQSLNGDRRKVEHQPIFPLVDSEGHQIVSERRSGNDRRKGTRGTDVVNKILNILN